MEETMLVTQALDERDLLMKKIRQKIQQASFMDYKKNNEKKTSINHVTEEEFADQARILTSIPGSSDSWRKII